MWLDITAIGDKLPRLLEAETGIVVELWAWWSWDLEWWPW
jgi:hypothetical protein